MQHKTAVSKKGANALLCRGKVVGKSGLEGAVVARRGDGAVLACEVADLARLGPCWVAGSRFAALVGVEVGEGAGAVAVVWYGLVVDVVDLGKKKYVNLSLSLITV